MSRPVTGMLFHRLYTTWFLLSNGMHIWKLSRLQNIFSSIVCLQCNVGVRHRIIFHFGVAGESGIPKQRLRISSHVPNKMRFVSVVSWWPRWLSIINHSCFEKKENWAESFSFRRRINCLFMIGCLRTLVGIKSLKYHFLNRKKEKINVIETRSSHEMKHRKIRILDCVTK